MNEIWITFKTYSMPVKLIAQPKHQIHSFNWMSYRSHPSAYAMDNDPIVAIDLTFVYMWDDML